MVLDHLWAKNGHNFGQKLKFSIFQKFPFLAVLRGFEGQIEMIYLTITETEDEKCIFRKSYFHRIQPNHMGQSV